MIKSTKKWYFVVWNELKLNFSLECLLNDIATVNYILQSTPYFFNISNFDTETYFTNLAHKQLQISRDFSVFMEYTILGIKNLSKEYNIHNEISHVFEIINDEKKIVGWEGPVIKISECNLKTFNFFFSMVENERNEREIIQKMFSVSLNTARV